MSRLWSSMVHNLHPYVPGEQPKEGTFIKLNTNENPYPPSPKVLAAIKEAANDDLRLYPDPISLALRKQIAQHHALEASQVFVGNGSDEVLAHIFHAFFMRPEPLQFPNISYSFYPVYCQLYGIEPNQVALNEDFEIELASYQSGPVILPNPNAPTGRLLGLEELEKRLRAFPDSLLVVDEAYIDFGGASADCLVGQYDNLLVTRTYSKSLSLAGIRLGYALGHAQLIEALIRVKDSFNSYPVDSLASAAGIAALADWSYYQSVNQQVIDNREGLVNQLDALGFVTLPSTANFVFTRHPKYQGGWLYQQLKDAGILVRHFNRPGLDQWLRISVGSSSDCDQLVKRLQQMLAAK